MPESRPVCIGWGGLSVVPNANCPINTVLIVGTPPRREDFQTELQFRRAYWSSPWCGRIVALGQEQP